MPTDPSKLDAAKATLDRARLEALVASDMLRLHKSMPRPDQDRIRSLEAALCDMEGVAVAAHAEVERLRR